MHPLDSLPDDEILAAFVALELSPSAFDHRGHLYIAWLHLQRYPRKEAVQRCCDGIEAFAAHLGAAHKFNRTLSEALLRLMAHAGAADPALAWDAFLTANPELLRDAGSVIARYYSPHRLALPEAHTRFLAPDLRPLPV